MRRSEMGIPGPENFDLCKKKAEGIGFSPLTKAVGLFLENYII
ncbi:MAG: hypothetical protein RR448_09870 [Niameybacter sp.]